ncbi:MAG: hypothetical protein JWL70_284 [Acidimicrobiia bacterium]|nr:hypothetical protein [Acidimicrobiia bacterium]
MRSRGCVVNGQELAAAALDVFYNTGFRARFIEY